MLTQVLMYVYEISRKKMEDYITHLAYIDTLTDLFNHHGLIRELENRIKKKEPFALLLIEIQNHNESSSRSGLNDIDVFTKKIIKILKSKNRFLARTNDNSFFYILNTSDKKAVELEGHKIHNSLVKLKNSIPEKQRFTTLSSAVLFDDPKYTPDDLIRFSRIALNESRLSLSQPINIFDETCLESLNRNQKITRLIKRGLKNNEFSIHYQPQIDARDGTLIGVEALLRWIRPSQESISPIELIETAEQSDLIYALGDFAIEKSLEGIQKLNKNYNGNLSIAINLTPRQLLFPNLLALLQRFIKDHHIKPGQIELEISENTLFSHKLQVMRTLRKMKKAGINLLINDFGNSTKNFDYLESYPITAIKINKSMIESIRKRPHRFKTVKLLIESLRTMGIQAIPNGIETLDQVRVLRQLGCSRMQGWYFSKALDLDSMQQFMSSYKPEAIFKKSP